MNILGRKAIGQISSAYGNKLKTGANTFGNKLVKSAAHTVLNHVVEHAVKHYSPLEKR